MKKHWIIISIVVLMIIGICVALFWDKIKNKQAEKNSTPKPSQTYSGFPLKQGSNGVLVSRLQEHLNARIKHANEVMGAVTQYPLLVVDGIFGPLTEKELRTYYNISEVSEDMYKNTLKLA